MERETLVGVFTETWRRAIVAEINWVSGSGPRGIPVVPVLRGGEPAAAVPYSRYDQVRYLADQPAILTVTDLQAGSTTARGASGRVRVEHDVDGDILIAEDLLIQEVIKHPPTKLRSDSLLARRENPWWTPRIVITLSELDAEFAIPGRTSPTDAVLVAGTPNEPRVTTVAAADWGGGAGDRVEVFGRDGNDPEGRGESVVAWSHQFSPDFEQWHTWYRAGHLGGTTLEVDSAQGAPIDELRPLRLRERYAGHRAAASACRRGLAEATREAQLGAPRGGEWS